MSITDDPDKVDTTIGPDGQQASYLVLSEAERAKGFVRPVRHKYRHVGIAGPKYPLRDLTDEQRSTFAGEGFVKYEAFPESERPTLGRYWTQKELDSVGKGCGAVTSMGRELSETYARSPYFYGGTFCATCRVHLPVGADGEFVWEDGSRVGT